MNFAFSPDQELLRQTARAFLEAHCPPAVVRGLWEDPQGTSEPLWRELARLGWLGLALPEAAGGAGLGMVEVALVLEELGRAAYPGPYLETVLAGTAIATAGSPAQQARWLGALAGGEVRATLALLDAELDWRPEATGTRATPGSDGGYRLEGVKQFVPWAHVADVFLVAALTPEGLTLFLLERTAPGWRLQLQETMDPGTRWATVWLEGAQVGAEAILGSRGGGAPLHAALLRRGAVGAAAAMLGAARRCLGLSVGYAKVREQFGQPIGAFQAIRHKCAEMLLEVETAHAAVYYAAWALDAGAEDQALAASVAKAYAGEAARRVCWEALQVHGGIGFTWEYDLHLYMKRQKALEVMYGDGDYHRELVLQLVAG